MKSNINLEIYNLDDGTYLVNGAGDITVNGVKVTKGTILTEPGYYEIVNQGKKSYHRRVLLVRQKTAPRVITFEENVMPIGGFFGPMRGTDDNGLDYDWITDEVFEIIKDSGVNLITYINNNYDYDHWKQDIRDCLALAEKYEVNTFVQHGGLKNVQKTEDIVPLLEDLMTYDSFKGISVIDEPSTDYYKADYDMVSVVKPLDAYKTRATLLNQFCNLVGYINLYPMLQHYSEDYKNAYDRYMEEYINTTGAKQIAFDFYVFDGIVRLGKHVMEMFFENLSVMREKSLKYDIPLWVYIQSGDWLPEPTTYESPTQGQLLWNVNTCLAYGAKGIAYYPLIQPAYSAYNEDGVYNYEKQGLIGANGKPTKWYEYAKKANMQIAAVDEVLLQAKSIAILAEGSRAQKQSGTTKTQHESLRNIVVSNPDVGVITGVFDYQGKAAFYVVNQDMEQGQDITLCFCEEVNYEVISATDNRVAYGNACVLPLEAGAAALVVVHS